ncbi:MAG: hypothetical protein ACQKBT_10515 [Puniceicoccales bacterium]
MKTSLLIILAAYSALWGNLKATPAPDSSESTDEKRIPIQFEIKTPSYVTLVIDDMEGKRVRNLVSQEQFPAGTHTVYWDGLDDLNRDPEAARHSVYYIPGRIVAPGEYTVRGLSHPGINLSYQLTPYTNGNPPWQTEDHGSQWLTNHSAPSDIVFIPSDQAPERDGKPTSKGGQLLVSSRVAEGGSGLAWLDMNGDKIWGQHWLGGVWTAASHMAVDHGADPVDGVYAYAAASWPGDKYNDYTPELRLHKIVTPLLKGDAPRDKRFGFGEDRPVLQPNLTFPLPKDVPELANAGEREMKAYFRERAPSLTGLAVHDGIIIAAMDDGKLWMIDVRKAKVLAETVFEDPRGLTFAPDGTLYLLSGNRLLKIEQIDSTGYQFDAPSVLIENLDEPQFVTLSGKDLFYISEWGQSHQIRVFTRDGTPRGAIGEPGPPQLGLYNPNHFNYPSGTAIDELGRLWVTENYHTPKRVSVWDLENRELLDAFYGPMRYGGSGAVDPEDKTRFFYDDDHGGTIEFKLDYETGTSIPVALPYLSRYDQTGLTGRYTGAAPSYPIHHGDFLYLTDAYNLHTTGRRVATLWRMDDEGIARIVAASGNILDSANQVLPAFQDPQIQAVMPEGFVPKEYHSLFFVWSDTNGNQKLDPAEVQFLEPSLYHQEGQKLRGIGTASIGNDLSYAYSHVGDAIIELSPDSIDENGVPIYDLDKRKVITRNSQRRASSGGDQVLLADDGWVVTTTPVKPFAREGVGAIRNGEAIWSYSSLWPGLHASHIAPLLEDPGILVGTTRVIGNVIDAPPGSEAGQLWGINANKGTIYIFTVDGLFVSRLFQDSRTASWNAPEAIRGMSVNDLSLQEECFGPMWTRTEDGEVYLQAGSTGSIIQVENLEKIARLPDQSIRVTAEQLQAAQQANIEWETKRQAAASANEKPLMATMDQNEPQVDGSPDDWSGEDWVLIDRRKEQVGNWGKRTIETKASVSIHNGKLYAIWKTYNDELLRSSGESMTNLFKTGGALDLFIGTDPHADPNRKAAVSGDQRLLVTQVDGKTVAVLYEPVSDSPSEYSIEFGSPLRTIQFDRVEVVSDQVELASFTYPDLTVDKDGKVSATIYEISIPLKTLHFDPQPTTPYKFDIGLLRGNGTQTLQRVYWKNKASGLVSDIPSEAELLPGLWGSIQFSQ